MGTGTNPNECIVSKDIYNAFKIKDNQIKSLHNEMETAKERIKKMNNALEKISTTELGIPQKIRKIAIQGRE